MTPLPVIVGFGGVNSAGRVSFDHAYRRLVIDALPEAERLLAYQSLATLMNLDGDPVTEAARRHIDARTLIRRVELFDPEDIRWNREVNLKAPDAPMEFRVRARQMPNHLPEGWQAVPEGKGEFKIRVDEQFKALVPDRRVSKVSSAAQVPTGFDPGAIYASRSHPRGLQLAIFGASDALRSSGLSLDLLKQKVAPDQFAVYSGSAICQLDADGYGGMMQNRMLGKRPTSKNGALGLPEMTGDFINAYVLGSAGGTAGIIGACATFLYNVKQGLDDIRSGAKRVVMVGNAEAPVLPEVLEAYGTMGALADDDSLMALDGSEAPDHRRACRPFSSNSGFTVGESSIYALLMDDALAVELGAEVLGAVAEVFVNADGYKKSIPGPGIGNYLTMGKALAVARSLLGEQGLRQGTYVQAHGTGTPQNRVTESHILNELAKLFGIEEWLVSAVKAYVGHSMAPAGGDQLASVLGAWQHGFIPGITTIDHIADDVHASHLRLPMQHVPFDPKAMPGAIINSKGFGGNNASGLFLAPQFTAGMLAKRWGKSAFTDYQRRNEAVRDARREYDAAMCRETLAPIYQFGEGVLEGEDLSISADGIRLPGFGLPVSLDLANPYEDMV